MLDKHTNPDWELEIERKSQWGHRLFCIAMIVGYPITSVLYYLNNPNFFVHVLFSVLLTSGLLLGLLILHFAGKIDSRKVSFLFLILLTITNAYIFYSVPHKTYERANINLTLALIFFILVLRWPMIYAVTISLGSLILIPMAIFLHNPDALKMFFAQGGLFLCLGLAVFPFIIRLRYNVDYKEFVFLKKLREQNEELEQQNELIQRSGEAKSNFLSTMSHEIRTPLNGIVGIVNILREDNGLNKEQKGLMETLQFSTEHLMSVVNNVLDFNKISSKFTELDASPFVVKKLLENLRRTFIPRIEEKGILLFFEVSDEMPQVLIGDEIRLNQIITNLIHNAIKFTSKGYVKLVVKPEWRDDQKVGVNFAISDTGVGISQEEQEKVFEVFKQASSGSKVSAGGTGLGLAITKELIMLHGSDIVLTSELGKGSEFSFTIEFPYVEEYKKEAVSATLENISENKYRKILVADDNNINLLIISSLLKKWGIDHELAHNGQEAVDLARSRSFDMVLMDLNMPVMDGFDALREIYALGIDIPIIAVSASAFHQEKERALSYGFTDYLVKPFLPEELYKMVSEKEINS